MWKLVVPLILVAGCATQTKYAQKLDAYVAVPEQTLVAEWGAPHGLYVADDGTRYLTYQRMKYYGPTGSTGWCDTTFAVVGGRISSYRFQGNDCAAK